MQREFRGNPVSPGIAIAPALVVGALRRDAPDYEILDADEEIARLTAARIATREDLQRLYRKTAMEIGEQHAEIFNAHLLLLDDVEIVQELEARIRRERRNAEAVIMDVTAVNVALLDGIDDPVFRERREDLLDVADRLVRQLLNESRISLRELDSPVIIAGETLPPSETASMNLSAVRGIALDTGGATSHTAILARALGIPAVMGLEDLSEHIGQETPLIIDGEHGIVIANPAAETVARYEAASRKLKLERAQFESAAGTGPCHTADGHEVGILANVALPLEVTPKLRESALGIGLYRTEFLYLNRGTLPSEEEQYEAYRSAVDAMYPLPVTIRTMDIGGDKFIAELGRAREENPQLGWRALRFCLSRHDIFKTQLRAILRASVRGNLQVMFPMVGGLGELREARRILNEVRAEFDAAGQAYDHAMRVGIMIEIPAAVSIAPMLAKECDFFSIGTNDLIQYTLAVDRGNEHIAHLYQPAHPAVLRMIEATATAAREAGLSCSVCGEMASEPRFAPLLIGLGIRSLSMSAFALPEVRALVGVMHLDEACALARQALSLGTAEEVEALLEAHHQQLMSRAALPVGTPES